MEIVTVLLATVLFGAAIHLIWRHISRIPTITTPARITRDKVRFTQYR